MSVKCRVISLKRAKWSQISESISAKCYVCRLYIYIYIYFTGCLTITVYKFVQGSVPCLHYSIFILSLTVQLPSTVFIFYILLSYMLFYIYSILFLYNYNYCTFLYLTVYLMFSFHLCVLYLLFEHCEREPQN